MRRLFRSKGTVHPTKDERSAPKSAPVPHDVNSASLPNGGSKGVPLPDHRKNSIPLPIDENNSTPPPKDTNNSTALPKDGDNGMPLPNGNHSTPLPNHSNNKPEDAATKRRALLVGISYSSPANKWPRLDGPHGDVDQYQELLVNTYGYRPEEIVVLKDIPEFSEHFQPTRVNLIRELNALVAGAARGDKFTFFYSGHSDQQIALVDLEEEDGMDEMLITSDEEHIIDDELKEILVKPLPVGCNLLAILDSCHSGTMLDLPHFHCNSVYVPWQSKGERRTMTMQNINVRQQTMDFSSALYAPPQSIESAIEGPQSPVQSVDSPLSTGQRELPRGRQRVARRPRERMLFANQTRYASPEARFVCDGWCKHSEVPHANVLSLSACSDLQRAWEGPKGSLTTVLCNYLKKDKYPSYGTLMSHINFQLHDNALALHEYTRHERKRTDVDQEDRFDGELDNFQEPELSSLVRLNMDHTLQL